MSDDWVNVICHCSPALRCLSVRHTDDGLLVFNTFIEKEYAPRGRDAQAAGYILGYWVQVLTGR